MAAGYFFMPEIFTDNAEHVLTAGLCLLLFMVGIDIGRQGNVVKDIRKSGLRILAVPCLVMLGTFAAAAVTPFITDLTLKESSAVAAGPRLVFSGSRSHIGAFRRTRGGVISLEYHERNYCDHHHSDRSEIYRLYRSVCSGGSRVYGHLSSSGGKGDKQYRGYLQFCIGIRSHLHHSRNGAVDHESLTAAVSGRTPGAGQCRNMQESININDRRKRKMLNGFTGSSNYVASDDLMNSVNVAMALKKPLLIKGEPGTGKTMLAEAIAESLGLELIIWNIKSTTKAQDGLYVYDTVAASLRQSVRRRRCRRYFKVYQAGKNG